jgi:hypothetical protein
LQVFVRPFATLTMSQSRYPSCVGVVELPSHPSLERVSQSPRLARPAYDALPVSRRHLRSIQWQSRRQRYMTTYLPRFSELTPFPRPQGFSPQETGATQGKSRAANSRTSWLQGLADFIASKPQVSTPLCMISQQRLGILGRVLMFRWSFCI